MSEKPVWKNVSHMFLSKQIRANESIFAWVRKIHYNINVLNLNLLALLQLESPINLAHENKGRICLPDNTYPLLPKTDCYISGWGNTENKGKNSEVLKHVHLKILPPEVCNSERVYNKTLHFSALCAGFLDKPAGSCNGDSGGSLVCEKGGRRNDCLNFSLLVWKKFFLSKIHFYLKVFFYTSE